MVIKSSIQLSMPSNFKSNRKYTNMYKKNFFETYMYT